MASAATSSVWKIVRCIALVCATLLFGSPRTSLAAEDIVLLSTAVSPRPAGSSSSADVTQPVLELGAWAEKLDAILMEGAKDLGLIPTHAPPDRARDEDALVRMARRSWVVAPSLSAEGRKLRVRLVSVAPGSNLLLMRSQAVAPNELEVRSLVMLRDLVRAKTTALTAEPPRPRFRPTPAARHTESEGRGILAVNGAVLGGYVGFSLQRASGSEDARVLYPLMALGTGIGLGGSLIIAEEWNITLGNAWYLSAAAWWPAASGLLLADSYVKNPDDRYSYGLLGAAAGLSLATTALAFSDVSEGGALLAHSGGAFGLLLGGVTDLAVQGRTDTTPTRGMGYGTAAGVLLAGGVASQLEVGASRVLMIDLSASLGALVGAALASPLLFVDDTESAARNRGWLASIAAGTVGGGVIGFLLTRGSEPSTPPPVSADVGVIGVSAHAQRREPIYGATLRGAW